MDNPLLQEIHQGWQIYQEKLVKMIAPLSDEQLALRISPTLRPAMTITAHIIAARVWWLHYVLGEGPDELKPLANWDDEGEPSRTAVELVDGLEKTWQLLDHGLTQWTEADVNSEFQYSGRYGERAVSRKWVLWHLLEHDVHHGGELSFVLGAHGIPAIDL